VTLVDPRQHVAKLVERNPEQICAGIRHDVLTSLPVSKTRLDCLVTFPEQLVFGNAITAKVRIQRIEVLLQCHNHGSVEATCVGEETAGHEDTAFRPHR
jgi:hypothetical protein